MVDRKITIIIYLNDETWDSKAGGLVDSGHLRIYLNADVNDVTGKSATSIRDIAPNGGRMVIFDSKKILHEVCPTHQRRLAITCWVGGNHTRHQWLRPLCVPLSETNWAHYFN
jgi:SM-20-related protein